MTRQRIAQILQDALALAADDQERERTRTLFCAAARRAGMSEQDVEQIALAGLEPQIDVICPQLH